jgi:hypothetical protein
MFKYLKEKVRPELYEDMKKALKNEYAESSKQPIPKEVEESLNSAREVINLVTKNSRNDKNRNNNKKNLDGIKLNTSKLQYYKIYRRWKK